MTVNAHELKYLCRIVNREARILSIFTLLEKERPSSSICMGIRIKRCLALNSVSLKYFDSITHEPNCAESTHHVLY